MEITQNKVAIVLDGTEEGITKIFGKLDSHVIYLGDLTKGFTASLKKKIGGVEEKLLELQSKDSFSLNKVFKPNGRLRNVVKVNGCWKLKFGSQSKTITMKHVTRNADVSYIALRVCMFYGIDENSVDALIIRHAVNSMY